MSWSYSSFFCTFITFLVTVFPFNTFYASFFKILSNVFSMTKTYVQVLSCSCLLTIHELVLSIDIRSCVNVQALCRVEMKSIWYGHIHPCCTIYYFQKFSIFRFFNTAVYFFCYHIWWFMVWDYLSRELSLVLSFLRLFYIVFFYGIHFGLASFVFFFFFVLLIYWDFKLYHGNIIYNHVSSNFLKLVLLYHISLNFRSKLV